MTKLKASRLVKPDRLDVETKVQYEWRILRLFLREAVHFVREAELELDMTVVHGLQYGQKVDLSNHVQLLQALQTTNRNVSMLIHW